MKIRSFRAWRPPVKWVDKVAAPPYDVVNTEEARTLAEGNPMCFLRVSRPELELPAGTDPYSEAVYARATSNFRLFQDQGYLAQDREPGLFLYRQTIGDHRQIGLVCVCHADDYERDVIKKHEKTRKAPEDDRTRHVRAIQAQGGPVFLAYRDQAAIDAAVAAEIRATPVYDFRAPDGVQHTVWRVVQTARFEALLAGVPVAYIADGHHRAAAAARVAREEKARNPAHTGNEEYNWFLAVLFPGRQLNILPYNRCVLDLNGLSPEGFLERLREVVTVSEKAAPQPAGPQNASLYLGGRWYGLSWPKPVSSNPADGLDVSVLQNRVLGPILGIDDPRTSKRIEFVGGIRGTADLVRRVDSGHAAAAFSLYPTTIDQLMQIADASQIMPPKSTWFEPKLKSGLLVHTFSEGFSETQ